MTRVFSKKGKIKMNYKGVTLSFDASKLPEEQEKEALQYAKFFMEKNYESIQEEVEEEMMDYMMYGQWPVNNETFGRGPSNE